MADKPKWQEKVFPNVRAIDPNFFDLGQRSEETFVLHAGGCYFGSISFAEHGKASRKASGLAFIRAHEIKSAACRFKGSHVPDYSPPT